MSKLLRGIVFLSTIPAVALASDTATVITPASANFQIDSKSVLKPNHLQRYIVLFDERNKALQSEGVIAALEGRRWGNSTVQRYTSINGFSVSLAPMEALALSKQPEIKSVEPDVFVGVEEPALPMIRAFTDAWGIDRMDQRALPLNGDYSPYYDGSGAHVYVLSSGIHTSHVEFTGRAQWVYTASTITDGDDDGNGRGTSLAGTVAGNTWGVARGANVYGVKVMNNLGQTSVAAVVEGLDWVANNHQFPAVAVVDMSIGYSAAVNQAVEAAIAAGVSVVVPSGDKLKDACDYSPGSAPNAITVAATWQSDEASHYSNRGSCVDIFAPGLYVKSAWHITDKANNSLSHSPVAAAHVAGAAAIVRANEPGCSVAGVKEKVVAQGQYNVLTNVLGGSPNRYAAVLTDSDSGYACDNVPVSQGSSCLAILQSGNSVGNGMYVIDPDGNNKGVQPFAVYCDMTTQGGGWTLFAYHSSGNNPQYASPVVLGEEGALADERWQSLRDSFTVGMMLIDRNGVVSRIDVPELENGNCIATGDVNSLVHNTHPFGRIWHSEVDGCGGAGGDYSQIILGPHSSVGASVYNLTGEFSLWPYTGLFYYGSNNELQYYIK